MDGEGTERRKGPVHARGRAIPEASEKRLTQLGSHIHPPSHDEDELKIIAGLRASRRRRHLLAWGAVVVVAALCAGAITQWVRPLHALTVRTVDVRLPGPAPSIAWPSTCEAAV